MKNKLTLSEKLTIEMTYLSNERSFLAYVRTVMVFLSSGVAIMEIKTLYEYRIIAYILLSISPIILIIGIYRFFSVKKAVNQTVEHFHKQNIE